MAKRTVIEPGVRRSVREFLRDRQREGVPIVTYVQIHDALGVSIKQLEAILAPLGGGNHGIRLRGLELESN